MSGLKVPKKLRISTKDADGNPKELGIMEQDGDKWFISGKHKKGISSIIGKRGMYYGGRILTVRDRALFLPLTIGYSNLVVDVLEQGELEDDNQTG